MSERSKPGADDAQVADLVAQGFGRDDPRRMSGHLFQGSLRRDYAGAVRADTSRQNFSVAPRYWYLDVVFACRHCETEFVFSVAEQRTWYEEHRFFVDSIPRHCPTCRRALRDLRTARQEYDRSIEDALHTDDLALKRRVVELIDQLCEQGGELPRRMHDNRARLARQIAREGA